MKKLILCLFLFLFSCQNEYINFHNENKNNIQNQEELNNFSFDKIEYLSGLTMKTTPDIKILDNITNQIDNAKERVYVEVYIFTEKRIRKALINAKKRWLDIKVLLEKNVYLANNLNTATFKEWEKNGIEMKYSNSQNYALNHSKMMIIDDQVIIWTANYSYSSFKYNREFFLFLKNEKLLKVFLDIFESDFNGIKKNIYQNNLLLSPFSSRKKIEYGIKNAKKSIQMYVENFSDRDILQLLLEKRKEWVVIQIIFPDLKKVWSNKEEVELLQKNNIEIKMIQKPIIHAKSLLIDEKYLYLWSENFSSYSLDKNREIWLFIINSEIITEFIGIFKADFEK